MAEGPDRESKTEEASPRRIEEALRKGNTPFSREVGNFAILLGVGLILPFGASLVATNLIPILSFFIDRPYDFDLTTGESAVVLAWKVLEISALAIGPILLALVVIGVLSSVVQNAPRIALERIKPTLSRLSLSQGLSRIWGVHGRTEFYKLIAKTVIMAGLFYLLIKASTQRVTASLQVQSGDLPSILVSELSAVFLAAGSCAAALAVADLIWARLKWRIDLRMSLQELREEQRQSDGDPMVRARQRSVARERARRRMINAVPRATLVVVNPTHYAVALRYVQGESAAPLVLAKGVDHLAFQIRRIAEENRIPVIEDRALARSLYAVVKTDRLIPPEFYRAIAEIILLLMARTEARSASAPVSGKPATLT